jgi:K+/H+ antiporter YhaU regulatory subunit KhtT
VVVAAVIQDAQTTKEAFGSDALANCVGDADASHTAGTTVVGAPKSLKQIISKGPNFAVIEQSGQE